MNPPALSVVMTTFRNPQALRLALVALAEEARAIGAVELLVGDDGDDEHASRGPCERIAEAGAFCSLQRFWQRRDGFRRARMLNHLVSRASAPQVLFLDGDCLVTRGLLSAHLSAFEPWRFLSGAMVRLGKEVSGGLSEDDARTFRHDRLSWALSTLARGGFDSTTKDLLVTVRFPAFYVCGAVLVGVGWLGVWIAGNSALLPANRRIGALVLLSVVLAVMAVDYVWIYLPLLQMVTPPGQAKPGHFRNYHEASKWINLVGLFLCLIASSIVNWPATSSRERELDSPNENLER